MTDDLTSAPARSPRRPPFAGAPATTAVRLRVDGIALTCTIGVTERERRTKQAIVVSLQLDVDVAGAGAVDSIEATADYRAVARRVIEEVEKSSFRLIETLGAHLGRTILDEFPRVQRARVEVEKPGALSAARSVAATVVVERPRGRRRRG